LAEAKKAIKAKCPGCHRAVLVPGTEQYASCVLCQTTFYVVSSRSAQPSVQPGYPIVVAGRDRGKLLSALAGFGLVALLAGIGLLGYQMWFNQQETSSDSPWADFQKISGEPMRGEVNGDGVEDIVVVTQGSKVTGPRFVSAIDPKTGRWLWTSEQISKASEAALMRYGVAADKVFVAKADVLSAYDLRTGKPVWKNKKLPERVFSFCQHDGGVAFASHNGVMYRIDPNKGHLTKLGKTVDRLTDGYNARPRAGRLTCWPISQEAPKLNTSGVRIYYAAAMKGFGGSDMKILYTLHWRDPEAFVGLGYLAGGHGTMAHMIVGHTRSKRLWKAKVATVPLKAAQGSAGDGGVTIRYGNLYITHPSGDRNRLHVVAFRLKDGKRLWDSPIDLGRETPGFEELEVTKTHIFVRNNWSIWVLERRTGKILREVSKDSEQPGKKRKKR